MKPSKTLGYEDLQKLAKRQKWSIRALAALLVIICTGIAWLIAYKAAEGFWLKTIVISAVDVRIHKAEAAEMTTTERKIRQAFGPHADTFLKIAMAESGQQSGNKGYNCYYGKKSMACKSKDRSKAWSVDCGLLMVNVLGTICPAEMFDIDYNIKAAQGKFERQGFAAWTVCRKKVVCK